MAFLSCMVLFASVSLWAQLRDSGAEANEVEEADREENGDLKATFNKPICFTDMASFAKVRQSLPIAIQNPPIFAVHRDFFGDGALKIGPRGHWIQLDAHVHFPLILLVHKQSLISRACVFENHLQVTLATGESQDLTFINDSFVINGYRFKQTNEATYVATAARVPAK